MDITNVLTDCVKNKKPVSFSKYGDGEYLCASGHFGHNCDHDKYTEKLKNSLIESFKYMVNNKDNSYIGLWFTSDVKTYWESLASKEIMFAAYHSLIIDGYDTMNKINLFKEIKFSKLKKILVSNPSLSKAKPIFNIDYVFNVNYNNWFDSYFDILINEIKKIINQDEQYIIITCAGMGSKVLICELTKLYPNNIYLDFGSSLDKICTKNQTRDGQLPYDTLLNIFNELIPENWDN